MGKKRRNYPDLEELLGRAWCYYCERDFEDLKLLISHQKAKHFKCERCGRRLNTAGGLNVHMNQVHKETLTQVENALEGREGLDVEIFGMEGIPEDALHQHNQQIIDDFHKNRADRQAATGNPLPGQPGIRRPPHKKIRIESTDELKARLAQYRAQASARKAAAEAAAAGGAPAGAELGSNGMPLPTRPQIGNNGSGVLPPRPSAFGASTLDDLVSSAAAAAATDDIDRVIRMAEAGIRPGVSDAPGAAPEKEKGNKKEKAMRMVYADGEFSLEEKMAQMPRYAVA